MAKKKAKTNSITVEYNQTAKGTKGNDVFHIVGATKSATIDLTNSGTDTLYFDVPIQILDDTKAVQGTKDLEIYYTRQDVDNPSMVYKLTIKNYFTSTKHTATKSSLKNIHYVSRVDGSEHNGTLVDNVQIRGLYTKKDNVIMGSKFSDIIDMGYYNEGFVINGGDGNDWINDAYAIGLKNDKINGGKGNDTIVSYGGDDVLTGGAGTNLYWFRANTGYNTVKLTKNESFNVKLENTIAKPAAYDFEKFGYSIDDSGNSIITFDKTDAESGSVTIKGFAKSDITKTATLTLGDNPAKNLKTAILWDKAITKKYDGSYLSENIDASLAGIQYKKVNKKKVVTNLVINGNKGHDKITGSAYNDTIDGGAGNDTIIGGTGKDKLTGGKGVDCFVFRKNDGVDTIFDADYKDWIKICDDDILASGGSDLRFAKNGDNLEIYYSDEFDPKNKIVVKNHFKAKQDKRIESLIITNTVGDDNETAFIDLAALVPTNFTGSGTIKGNNANNFILGSAKADTIKALGGDDIIKAGLGKDKIYGGKGVTTIKYNTLDELAGDKIYLTKDEKLTIEVPITGIVNNNYNGAYDGLTYKVSGKDLVVYVKDGERTESFTLVGFAEDNITGNPVYIKGSDNSKQQLYEGYFKAVSSNGTRLADIIDHSKSKKAVNIDGKGGTDIITGSKYDDTIKAGESTTTVTGGKGNDKLYGAPGQYYKSTFVFYKGDGKDTLYGNKGENILNFADATDIKVTKSKQDLIISYNFNAKGKVKDSVTVKNYYDKKGNVAINVGSIVFGGNSFKVDELLGKTIMKNEADELIGTDGDDFIIATGTQTINSGAGNDIIYSNNANEITTGTGDNTIVLKKYSDQIINPTEGEHLTIKMDGSIQSQWNYFAYGNDIKVSGTTTSGVPAVNFYIKDAMLEENKGKYDVLIRFPNRETDLNDVLIVNSVPSWRNDQISKVQSPTAVVLEDSAGNDRLYGSAYDDTLYGGIGNDYLAGQGGADTYYVSSLDTLTNISEQSAGKNISDGDILNIDASKDEINIFFNVKKDGTFASNDGHLFLVNDEAFESWKQTGNYPISGVQIQYVYNAVETINSNDGYKIANLEQLKSDVAGWLASQNGGEGYTDVSAAIQSGNDVSQLYAIFESADNWAVV